MGNPPPLSLGHREKGGSELAGLGAFGLVYFRVQFGGCPEPRTKPDFLGL